SSTPQVMAIQSGSVQKYNPQGKAKKKGKGKDKQPNVGASSTPQVMAIQSGSVQKYKPQGKAKKKGKRKGKEMKRMQNVSYASVVGSIMYAVRCTRHDVTFTQNITRRFQQNSELRVNCYYHAGFETNRGDTKSQTGYVFILNGGTVVWKSIKQSTTAQHVIEAEYIAASEAAKKLFG
nr:hypothetical protein [Tanacetum cinerariifolium]